MVPIYERPSLQVVILSEEKLVTRTINDSVQKEAMIKVFLLYYKSMKIASKH